MPRNKHAEEYILRSVYIPKVIDDLLRKEAEMVGMSFTDYLRDLIAQAVVERSAGRAKA